MKTMTKKADNFEVVCEGWLTKSPPTGKWSARWRRRWFVLRHSGELPGQYFLCYYTDHNCRKLKGQIDLDECEQVDAGLRFDIRNKKYQNMFTVGTPKRTYHLAADCEEDMNRWVDCVCHVCGLKPMLSETTIPEFEDDEISQEGSSLTELSPPVTPSTLISKSPYIAISECHSGAPINNAEDMRAFLATHVRKEESYDKPRNLRPPPTSSIDSTDSVFTDDEDRAMEGRQRTSNRGRPKPAVNWDTFPRPSDSSVDEDFGKDGRVDRKISKTTAPPRPPKPSHFIDGVRVEHKQEDKVITQDDMYDIPRSHQIFLDENGKKSPGRHCYTNAAPGHVDGGPVFRYDAAAVQRAVADDGIPDSPRSESGSAYSNTRTPPAVNRELKPGRKYSESTSNEPSPAYYGPNVDRKLKPTHKVETVKHEKSTINALKLSSPPAGSLGRRKQRTGPSSMVPTNGKIKADGNFATTSRMHRRHSSSDDQLTPARPNFYYLHNSSHSSRNRGSSRSQKFNEIQYLDLDLDRKDFSTTSGLVKKSSENLHTTSTATVYKTVDFLKTIAFNRTRIEVEEERNNRLCMDAESAL